MANYTTIQEVKPKLEPTSNLFDDEKVEVIHLRDEQLDAIKKARQHFKKKTGNQFLWNAKMRFGKTLCALQLSREMSEWDEERKVHRTLIVTHRPSVSKGWREEFDKIFYDKRHDYGFGTKFEPEADGEDQSVGNFYDLERMVREEGKHYVFFASMQYLRRSSLVAEGGDDDQLKADILNAPWDLVVVDEAHEGTRTHRGQMVINYLKKPGTKVLQLSGTPFNLYEDFGDDEIYTWDYIKEQTAKRDWPRKHPKEPAENNPYRQLPQMEIRTYDLANLVKDDLGENVTFQFKEFFRTWTGNPKTDHAVMPEGRKGRFVHEDAVRKFLDLLCADDENSHYPFSCDEFRQLFNHTLWVVPGVKEAKALENLLHEHEIFGSFDYIINVAGNSYDDESRSDALSRVLDKIGPDQRPELTYSITISCGRLTTGVTVKPWTAVLYLKGSENTSAATYMQTIFRVQSPYEYQDDGRDMMKTKCYVFDFAPDRSLKIVAETAKFSTLTTAKERAAAAATPREQDIKNMEDFLSFCPVISMDGGQMVEYEPERLFEQLEHVYIDRVVRNGFNDNSLYDLRALMNLDSEELSDLNDLGSEIAKTTNMEKPKRAVDISHNGLTAHQQDVAARAQKKKAEKQSLTPEEQAALDAVKKRKEQERKERDNRITILRGISLRIPLMMYGADVDDDAVSLTLDNFTDQIDPASWAEFMPRGMTKQKFNSFRKCYNATVFAAAGRRYRELAREADQMHTEERVQRIAEIFGWFHNPDKETVLTPWPVVNRHLSDCLGGYCFYNERFDGPNQREVPATNGQLFEWVDTNEPRFVSRGQVTSDVFDDRDANILEINSKTGLYPLYMTYSLYRTRKNDFEANGLIKDVEAYSVEEEQVIWDDILMHDIYVVCNTDMARRITIRTLAGFRQVEGMHVKSDKLIEKVTTNRESLIKDIQTVGYWNGTRNKDKMKFKAIVGNPPYQAMDGGAQSSAVPIYHQFVEIARLANANYISMIMPSRWLSGGRGLNDFRDTMLKDKCIRILHDFTSSKECFPTVEIKGGICYFLRSDGHEGKCMVYTHNNGTIERSERYLLGNHADTFIRSDVQSSILAKVKSLGEVSFNEYMYAGRYFGFHTKVEWTDNKEGMLQTADGKSSYPIRQVKDIQFDTKVYIHGGICWIRREDVKRNNNSIDVFKLLLPRSGSPNTIIIGRPKISEPGSCSSNSFSVVVPSKGFKNESEVKNCEKYCFTKFFRLLVATKSFTQMLSPSAFEFVPWQDFTPSSDIDWSKPVSDIDQQLYKKYGLTAEEVNFIESMIKPME